MRLMLAAAVAMSCLHAATPAFASCADDINKALPQARALPDPKGRAAVLEEIERARIAHHEGDEDACVEQMREVFLVMQPVKEGRK